MFDLQASRFGEPDDHEGEETLDEAG